MTYRFIDFAPDFAEHLRWMGVDVGPMPGLDIHVETEVEGPVSLCGLDTWQNRARVGAFTYFGTGCVFHNASIGRYCSVAKNLQVGMTRHPTNTLTSSPIGYLRDFMGFETHFAGDDPAWRRALPVMDYELRPETRIGNDVWIGADVYIKDGVTIGDGAVLGAHAVVTRDVAPYAVVAGSPARVIRMRFDDATVERLLRVAWWRYNLLELGGLDLADIHASLDALEERIAGGLAPYAPPPINLVAEYARFVEVRDYLARQRA